MLHKKSIIFALFHKYTVYFAWVAVWAGKQTVFFVRQTVWQVLFVGENSTVSLICGRGGGMLCANCFVSFLSFSAVGWLTTWCREGVSIFFCLKQRFVAKGAFLCVAVCACFRK